MVLSLYTGAFTGFIRASCSGFVLIGPMLACPLGHGPRQQRLGSLVLRPLLQVELTSRLAASEHGQSDQVRYFGQFPAAVESACNVA